MELENRVASGRCVPATFGRACRYDYQEGRPRTRRRLSRQLDLRTTERQRQGVEDLEDYVVVRPRRCRAQAPVLRVTRPNHRTRLPSRDGTMNWASTLLPRPNFFASGLHSTACAAPICTRDSPRR